LPKQNSLGFPSIVRAKSHAAQTVLAMLARTNEAQLKKQALSRLPELLRLIQDEDRARMIELNPH
jgi:hypothetical protein